MTMKKIPLDSASASQLAEYAENVLGLDGIDYRLGSDKILAKMRAAMFDKEFIEVDVPEPAIQRIDPPLAGKRERRMATVFINVQETPGGADPVPVAVNGKQLFIPRDKPHAVPWEYYHALDLAKKLVYEQDEIGRLKPNPKEVHEYSFSLIHEDPPIVEEKKAA
jgi:hypothetical protein